MAGPLSHIRVLDLSRVLAGPWAGQNLADLGAEVIKIERPGAGDDSRAFGPPWVKDRAGRDTRESAYFTSANRGKKSVTVNIAAAEGQALVRELARASDVLIENYKFGDLARYGLGYERRCAKLNPRLIYCSVTGFGQTGPYRERPGYDFMIQGMGGMMSITGEPDGEPAGAAARGRADRRHHHRHVRLDRDLRRARAPRATPARASTSTSRCSTRRSRCSPTRTPTTSRPARRRSASATCTRTSCPTSRSAQPTATSSSPAATTTCSGSSARPRAARSLRPMRASPPTASAWKTAPS